MFAPLLVMVFATELHPRAPDEPTDATVAIAWLDAPTAVERERGERWLARRLLPEHRALLRPLLAQGSWESALRARSVLAVAPRGLDVAVRLATDDAERVRVLARAAIEERIARWTPGWDRPLDARGVVIGALVGKGTELVALDQRARSGRVDLAVRTLVRGARGMPNCVVLPGASSSTSSEDRRLVAGFDVVLGQLARSHDLVLAGLGFSDDLDGRAARCVVLRGPDEVEGSGLELVASWCLAAASTGAEPARRAAARALGGSGWPDAVAWMEERWLAERELVWLDGLLAAADRGALAPCFRAQSEREWIARWFAEPARDAAPELRAERAGGLARALALAGSRDETGTDARGWLVLEEGPRTELANWARLVVLEGLGIADATELARLDARIVAWSADGAPASSVLLARALRARGAGSARPGTAVGAFELARPEAIFESESRAARTRALVELLVAARAEPPARWDDPANLPKGWPHELSSAACEWMLASGRPAAACARHVEALVAARRVEDRRAACELLRRAARRLSEDRVRSVVSDPMLRVALALANAEERAAAGSEPLRDGDDLVRALAFGELASRGDLRARTELLRLLSDARLVALAGQAFDWAVAGLRARRDEDGERELVKLVRAAAQSAPSAARIRFRGDAWPATSFPEPIDLDDLLPEVPLGWR